MGAEARILRSHLVGPFRYSSKISRKQSLFCLKLVRIFYATKRKSSFLNIIQLVLRLEPWSVGFKGRREDD